MTTQTSFSERRSLNHRFFNGNFFRFQLKTGWPLLVVFSIVFILSMIVPSVSYVTDLLDSSYESYPITESICDKAVEFLYTLGVANVLVSMAGGFLCGLTTMRYTNNKVAVNFYHSLPMRREALFTTSTLQTFLYFAAAFVTALLVVFCTFAGNLGEFTSFFIRPILLTMFYGILFFLLVYSMTLFGASVTGTGLMRFIGGVYVIGLPVITFIIFVVSSANMGIYESIIDTDYYLSPMFLIPLCAPLRFINLLEDVDNTIIFRGILNKETLIVFATVLIFYGLAFFLYCIRPSESASKPVIWRPASFIFKYVSMFIGGSLFGLIFYGILYSTGWMVFGVIIGSFILFMLTNGILNKSPRAIFRNVRGFIIFMAVMAVITTVFYVDVFGIFADIPDGGFVHRVELIVDNNTEVEYTGDFASKATNIIGKNYTKEYGYYNGEVFIIDDDKYSDEPVSLVYSDTPGNTSPFETVSLYNGYQYDSISIEAVFHTKIGIPYAVKVYPTCEQACELVKFMYDTGKIPGEMPDIKSLDSGYVELYLGTLGRFENTGYYEYYDDTSIMNKYNTAELYAFAEKLSDPAGLESSSPVVGQFGFYHNAGNSRDDFIGYYNNNGRHIYFMIHASDYEVINELVGFEMFTCEEDVIDYYIEENDVEGLYVIDNDTNESIYITDPVKVRDMITAFYSTARYYDTSVFCSKDHRYNVFVMFDDEQSYSENLFFRRGCVPSFVEEIFAGK